jgi:two-component system, OmpR family, sensor kinase
VLGAFEERTRLLAAIAHDLRTPLTRIRFRAEHVPPEQRARINEDVERMDAMIAGVLAFVRGEQSVERQKLDLSALVRSVVDDWTDSGTQISMTETPPLLVEGDAMALRRMITNIIDNAVRYGRQTHCRVERTNGDAVLTVDDAGLGVEEADYARLLSPFERGASNRDPSTGGVGLGLPIARGIAQAHGGELSLHRSELGGLKVRVRFPIP